MKRHWTQAQISVFDAVIFAPMCRLNRGVITSLCSRFKRKIGVNRVGQRSKFVVARSLLSYGLLVLFFGGAQASEDLIVHVNPKSPQFRVMLPANPSTGYQWTLKKYDQNNLMLIHSQYLAPHSNRIGAGGQMIFTFKPVADQAYPPKTEMTFQYARAWESKKGESRKVIVLFVRDPPKH